MGLGAVLCHTCFATALYEACTAGLCCPHGGLLPGQVLHIQVSSNLGLCEAASNRGHNSLQRFAFEEDVPVVRPFYVRVTVLLHVGLFCMYLYWFIIWGLVI